jgi:Amt family ammonium transporter
LVEYEGIDVHLHGSPCYPAQAETTAPLALGAELETQKETALLEEALARDARREKIYSEKLGRWIYAEPK